MTGPNPVDRGKSGSKIHVLSDRTGLPLSVAGTGYLHRRLQRSQTAGHGDPRDQIQTRPTPPQTR